jgi:predicted AAA+ superfamily ATPase
MELGEEAVQVLRDLNPWWGIPAIVRPEPPAYRRRAIVDLSMRLAKPRSLIEVVRGPRQVGKTTGIHQIIQDLIRAGTPGTEILFVRFDLELLREEPAGLRRILRWYASEVRRRNLSEGPAPFLFLDEVHKLRRWSEEIKHVGDTYHVRMLLTGSSSVLVARGGRESLAGRVFTTELPPFSFREVVECWHPKLGQALPKPLRFIDAFDGALVEMNETLNRLRPQQRLALSRVLERYFNRGGYPRLHSGEVDDDRWADYLSQTIFENVLGADIPDLFPVANPALLRHIYLAVARLTGREIAQFKLAQDLSVAGLPANQPTVGRYLHYLDDALLIREFRRYPLSKRSSARVPAKLTVTDLGVRNAVFRSTPSLWESDPAELGPLVETLVQGAIRDANLQVHFYRDYENPKDRRSPIREVDFVAEQLDGRVLPIEVKFRRKVTSDDLAGLRFFRSKFDSALPIIITRDTSRWDLERILHIPLQNFLLAF